MRDIEPVFRLFIAVTLPDAVKNAIETAQAELRKALPHAIRWTKRDQFHLTLRFLGNVPAARVTDLEAALRRACGNFTPLQLRAGRIGFFPDPRRPRVVWVGVADGSGDLLRVQQSVEAAAGEFTQEPAEGPFSGHVTLGRIRHISRPEAKQLAELAEAHGRRSFGEWRAEGVELIRSDLGAEGARHTTLAAIPLAVSSPAR